MDYSWKDCGLQEELNRWRANAHPINMNQHDLVVEELINRALEEVQTELERARKLHPTPMRSAHEGHSIIEEEYEELRAEVFRKPQDRSEKDMRKEACQLAAMAVRFMLEVTRSECK